MKPDATRYGRLLESKLFAERAAERAARKATYWLGRFTEARKRAARYASKLEQLEADAAAPAVPPEAP